MEDGDHEAAVLLLDVAPGVVPRDPTVPVPPLFCAAAPSLWHMNHAASSPNIALLAGDGPSYPWLPFRGAAVRLTPPLVAALAALLPSVLQINSAMRTHAGAAVSMLARLASLPMDVEDAVVAAIRAHVAPALRRKAADSPPMPLAASPAESEFIPASVSTAEPATPAVASAITLLPPPAAAAAAAAVAPTAAAAAPAAVAADTTAGGAAAAKKGDASPRSVAATTDSSLQSVGTSTVGAAARLPVHIPAFIIDFANLPVPPPPPPPAAAAAAESAESAPSEGSLPSDIDPEVFAALPEEMRAELLAERRAEQREAAGAGAGGGGGGGSGGSSGAELAAAVAEVRMLLDSLPAEAHRDVLGAVPDNVMAALPPDLQAAARRARGLPPAPAAAPPAAVSSAPAAAAATAAAPAAAAAPAPAAAGGGGAFARMAAIHRMPTDVLVRQPPVPDASDEPRAPPAPAAPAPAPAPAAAAPAPAAAAAAAAATGAATPAAAAAAAMSATGAAARSSVEEGVAHDGVGVWEDVRLMDLLGVFSELGYRVVTTPAALRSGSSSAGGGGGGGGSSGASSGMEVETASALPPPRRVGSTESRPVEARAGERPALALGALWPVFSGGQMATADEAAAGRSAAAAAAGGALGGAGGGTSDLFSSLFGGGGSGSGGGVNLAGFALQADLRNLVQTDASALWAARQGVAAAAGTVRTGARPSATSTALQHIPAGNPAVPFLELLTGGTHDDVTGAIALRHLVALATGVAHSWGARFESALATAGDTAAVLVAGGRAAPATRQHVTAGDGAAPRRGAGGGGGRAHPVAGAVQRVHGGGAGAGVHAARRACACPHRHRCGTPAQRDVCAGPLPDIRAAPGDALPVRRASVARRGACHTGGCGARRRCTRRHAAPGAGADAVQRRLPDRVRRQRHHAGRQPARHHPGAAASHPELPHYAQRRCGGCHANTATAAAAAATAATDGGGGRGSRRWSGRQHAGGARRLQSPAPPTGHCCWHQALAVRSSSRGGGGRRHARRRRRYCRC